MRRTYPVVCAMLLLVLSAPLVAQTTQLAKVQNLGDTLVFTPVVEFRELVLTVTGPCDFAYRQVVDRGELSFRLGETTIDGVYRYDLTRNEAIDPGIIKILQQARIKDDLETPKALCRDGKLPAPPASQSAGFHVQEGRIIYDPRSVEKVAGGRVDADGVDAEADGGEGSGPTLALRDFVIADDLIVDGSACIGFDCVNGESFGFDTIRVKENNLRIKFDDTSTAASFPRNDWQLTANDSANGGASKFSIDDISGNRTPFTVEANARSHSLYVDDGGRIGSRTSTPSVEIHTIDGDTPTLRLQQDGSSGFAPQTWDVAGNETNFFVRDVTNGSALPFRIRPGAPSSSIFVDVDGDVGIGTSSPDANFDVEDSVAAPSQPMLRLNNTTGPPRFEQTNGAGGHTWRQTVTGTGDYNVDDILDGTIEFTLAQNGNLTVSGSLFSGGGTCGGGCDAVFQPGYAIESIDEHAVSMWQNSHLPAVGPTPENEVWNLTEKTGGILNELEKAHIYIQQLHERLAKLETALSERGE